MQLALTKSPNRTRTYLRQLNILKLLVVLLFIAAVAFLWFYYDLPFYGTYIFVGLAFLAIVYFLVHPVFIFNYYQYRITDQHIEIQKNWWFRKNKMIQIERIQYIERKTGPLMRRFTLNRLVCRTAGHEITLPLLDEIEAERIECYCLAQLKGGDSDV